MIWISALAAVGVLCLVLKNQGRLRARQTFVILVSLFVVHSLVYTSGKEGKLSRSQPVLETDRAEVLLRFDRAMIAVESWMTGTIGPSGGDTPQFSALKQKEFHSEAKKVLEESIEKKPDASVLKVKLAIILGDAGRPQYKSEFERVARELASDDEVADSALGKALLATYLGKSVSSSEARTFAELFQRKLDPGWYRDTVLLRLYKVSADSTKYELLKKQFAERGLQLFWNVLIILCVGGLAILVGVVTIVVQLFTLPRRLGDPEDEAGGKNAVPWSLSTVYAVFLFWLATQFLIGGMSPGVIKSFNLLDSGALMAAACTALLYVVSNGPGVLYVHLLACRPYQLGFFETIRLTTRAGSLGPVRLVLSGIFTWCSAVPIVIVAYLLAFKFLGSQGSSNPIISLVLDAARSSNLMATVLFYATLGVLAPFVEETLFRGFLYRSLRKYAGVGTSVFASGALFAAVHMDAGAIVPLMCLGCLFAFVFERTKSLLPAMIAHGMWNSGTFTLVLLMFG